MIFDYKEEQNKYVVHSKKNGNEVITTFTSIDKVADFVEQEENVTGVWYMMSCKLPEGVYRRKEKIDKK